MEMKRVRRALILVLALCLVLPAFGSVSAQEAKSDIAGHWAEGLIAQWAEKGWIFGYGDGTYKPNRTISRGEWMAFVERVFGPSAAAEAETAVQAGAIPGYDEVSLYGKKPVTRQEAAVLMAGLLHLADEQAAAERFQDAGSLAAWGAGAIGALAEKSILSGYTDGTFRPDGIVTRAEAVSMLSRALDKRATVYAAEGTYGPANGRATVNGDVTIASPGVTLRNTIVQGNLLIAESVGEGDVFLDNVTVRGTTTVSGGGSNSVHLRDTVLVTVIVNKSTGEIRIVAEGTTRAEQVTLQSGAKLDASSAEGDGAAFGLVRLSELLPEGATVTLLGTFDEVEVFSQSVAIDVPQGAIRQLSAAASSAGTTLTLGEEARIAALILEAVLKVLGEGAIDKAVISEKAAGSTFEKPPAQQEGSGSSASSAGSTGGSVGGGGGGGGSSGSPDTTPPALSGVSAGTVTSDVYGTSSENGTLYLVPKGTAAELSQLTNMSVLPTGNRVAASAGQSVAIDTTGLPAGTYVLHAVDASGNLSAASADIELTFAVSSSAFADGAPIPAQYTLMGGNVSIPLAWRHSPNGTQSFMVLMYDEHPDAADFIHWHAINIPADVNAIAANASRTAMPAGSLELHHTFGDHILQGERGYAGPMPPAGIDSADAHRYRTVIFALSDLLDANDKTLNPDHFGMAMTVTQLRDYLGDLVLGEASWTGTYFTPAAPLISAEDAEIYLDTLNDVYRILYDVPANHKIVYAFYEWLPPYPPAGEPIPLIEIFPGWFHVYDDSTGFQAPDPDEGYQYFFYYILDADDHVVKFHFMAKTVS